ncbi:MAG: hypothetical protein ACTJLM_05005 [Ehrlichia sp.]
MNGKHPYDSYFIGQSLVVFICLFISVIHLIMYFQGITVKFRDQASLSSEEKGKEILAFFGHLSHEELSKVTGNNITRFQTCSSTNEFDVSESRGLLPSRKFKLQLDDTLGCKILFGVKDIRKLQSPGLCIFVQVDANTSKIKEKIRKLQGFSIRFAKVENGRLLIYYRYLEPKDVRASKNEFTFCSMHKNCLLREGHCLDRVICEDLEDELERCICAIASYKDCEHVVPTCDFLKCLLRSRGYEGVICETESMLSNMLYKEIKCNTPYYESMMIFHVARRLFPKGDKLWYTGYELVDGARNYIVNKYMSRVAVFESKFSSMRIGNVEKIVFVNEGERACIASNVAVSGGVMQHGSLERDV